MFGDAQFTVEGRAALRVAPKTLLLLAYVILHQTPAPSRESIASALWPDVRDSDARTNLRRHLLLLQRVLAGWGSARLISSGNGLLWECDPATTIDVREFDRFAAFPETAERAIEIYRGDLLERFPDEWLTPIRERYRRRCISLLEQLFAVAENGSDTARALPLGRRLLALDPVREDVVRRMMELRLANGDRAGALHEYQRFAAHLRYEFSAEPMLETTQLYESIRMGRNASTQIVQLAVRGARSLGNLDATKFIGRERELSELQALLRTTRILSLVGVGGIGKSRLANALAVSAADGFMNGARFVELVGLPDDVSPLLAVVQSFGLAATSAEAMQRILVESLRQNHLLIVLNNCERHVDACRHLVETIAANCPNVSIVTTSRVVLQALHETVYQVGPLFVPTRGDLTAESSAALSDAVQLFLNRVEVSGTPLPQDDSEMAAVVDICRHLDGIPLAIELAAARRKVLSAEQIRDRLHDRPLIVDFADTHLPPHQRTVRSAIAWSFSALPVEERRALDGLSILRAPFTIAVVERMIRSPDDAVDLVSKLVDNALLFVNHGTREARYRMLEPVREFALDELEGSGGAATAYARAAGYYGDFTAKISRADTLEASRLAFDVLEVERANLRAVLEGCAQYRVDDPAVLQLAASLVTFWQEHGHVTDGLAVHRALLEAFPQATMDATLLLGASRFALLCADYGAAHTFGETALQSARFRRDAASVIDALHALGIVDYTVGDLERSEGRHAEARDLAAELNDRIRLGRALANLGLLHVQRGAHDAAAHNLGDAVRALVDSGNDRLLAEATSALAYCERFRGNLTESRSFSQQTLDAARGSGNFSLQATSLTNLAHLDVLEGRNLEAIDDLRESLKLSRSGAFLFTLVHNLEIAARIFHAIGRFRDAAIFLYGSRSLSTRLRVLRTRQEEAGLETLEVAIVGKLTAIERAEATVMLRDAPPSRCADEALARLGTARAKDYTGRTQSFGSS